MDQILCTGNSTERWHQRTPGGVRSYQGSQRFTNKIILEPGEEHLALGRDLGFLICKIGTVAELS